MNKEKPIIKWTLDNMGHVRVQPHKKEGLKDLDELGLGYGPCK